MLGVGVGERDSINAIVIIMARDTWYFFSAITLHILELLQCINVSFRFLKMAAYIQGYYLYTSIRK